MREHWAKDAVFYHVYPLGACGAPSRNDLRSATTPRLSRLFEEMDHWQRLGVNGLYLGPLFESSAHGYDTADYFRVDRRLGDMALVAKLVRELHSRSIRVILDGVFNHVGREFWAFQQLRLEGEHAACRDWFKNVRFDARSPFGDPFSYEGWHGCLDLVRLNLGHLQVRQHLLAAVGRWMDELDIDGLRLDVADELEPSFLRELASFCRAKRPNFWLLGEMIHGDYRRIVSPEALDSATNYECYKGLWSSLNDHNYFEIAHALQRQFGPQGIYRELPLYDFVDNHDVSRVATILKDPRHLYPLYLLLFCMPGVPALYYGSEWGMTGRKEQGDPALRPALPAPDSMLRPKPSALASAIAGFARMRHASPALRHGGYRQLLVQSERFAFAREADEQTVVVALNSASSEATLELEVRSHDGVLVDLLDATRRLVVTRGRTKIPLDPCSGRALRLER